MVTTRSMIGITGAALAAGFAAGFYTAVTVSFNESARGILRGPATVYDGDTLTVIMGGDKQSVRLYAVDAPERGQTCTRARETVPCGRMAKDAVEAMIAGQDIKCEEADDRDRYGRAIAVCFSAAGTDIGGGLIAQGLAIEYKAYSDGRYTAAEEKARAAQTGLWGMTFEDPARWRTCHTGPKDRRPASCGAAP